LEETSLDLDFKEILRDSGTVTQFIYTITEDLGNFAYIQMLNVNTMMLIDRGIFALSCVHIEEDIKYPFRASIVFTIAGDQLELEEFIRGNFEIDRGHLIEYVGAMILHAE
tara:strand:+ start:4117 stop:4449 length:333 start_codon:yes stop_codon:yes gene_type:complete